MRIKMKHENFEKVYRENEYLQMQVKNLDAMVDENNELKAELKRVREATPGARMEELVAENQRLKTRNGELLIKCSDLDDDKKKLQDKIEFTKKSVNQVPQPGD